MIDTDILRAELVRLIDGLDAHMTFEEAVVDFPADAMNTFPPNVSYTPWHLLEHLRITQADILDYIVNRDYREIEWPLEYWPARDAMATPEEWQATIDRFLADVAALRDIIYDPDSDLEATIPGTPGHTILREVRVAADHNAYHVGEFAVLRQIMGTWPKHHET